MLTRPNLTPVVREGYRIGVPKAGLYKEVLNSDSSYYGGSNVGNGMAPLLAEDQAWMNRPNSIAITLPPLAAVVFRYEGEPPKTKKLNVEEAEVKTKSKAKAA